MNHKLVTGVYQLLGMSSVSQMYPTFQHQGLIAPKQNHVAIITHNECVSIKMVKRTQLTY